MDGKGLITPPNNRGEGCLLIIIAIIFLLSFLFSSCKTKYIETERVVNHYNVKVDTLRDSIAHDVFVKIWQKGDTIYRDSIVKVYKDRSHTAHDTLIIRDTLRVTQTTPAKTTNKLTWWQSTRIALFNWLAAIIAVGVLVWFLKSFKR